VNKNNISDHEGSSDLHRLLKHRRLLIWIQLTINGITSLPRWDDLGVELAIFEKSWLPHTFINM